MTPEIVRALEAVAMHSDVMKQHQESLGDLVHRARQAGASWSSVGRMLGISKQAARARFEVNARRVKPQQSSPELALF